MLFILTCNGFIIFKNEKYFKVFSVLLPIGKYRYYAFINQGPLRVFNNFLKSVKRS